MNQQTTHTTFYADSRVSSWLKAILLISIAVFLVLLALLPLLGIMSFPSRQASITVSELIFLELILGVVSFGFFVWGIACYAASHTRLIITPAGIEYHDVGYFVKTTWDNLERIALLPQHYNAMNAQLLAQQQQFMEQMATKHDAIHRVLLDGYIEGIILRQSVAKAKSWWTGGMIPVNRMIPLSEFKWWRHGELGQELKRYAPQLFDYPSANS